MIGILVVLIISWLLLWFTYHKHLTVLGIKPTPKRLAELSAGLIIAGGCCIVYHLMGTLSWRINQKMTTQGLLNSSWWVLKSVLFEELIFRGALLYIAVRKFGVTKACMLSAICFGIYHLFSYNAFGNPVQMFIVFMMTAIIGWIFSFAFVKTGSLYLPFALHFGWNYLNIVVFSSGPLGTQILIRGNENKSLWIFLFQVFALPLITYLYLSRSGRKTHY